MQVGHGSVGQMGRFCSWVRWVMGQGQKYDGSRWVKLYRAVISILQERSTRIWCNHMGSSSMGVKKQTNSAKTLKNGHYSAFNARYIITPLRNRLSPNVIEAIPVNLEIKKKSFALKFNFPSNTFLNQVMGHGSELRWVKWVMGKSPDGSHGSLVEHK